MPQGIRNLIFWLYLAVALAVPLWVVLMPGQPPLALNPALLELDENQRFATPQQALGEGAENFQQDVFDDLAQRLDGIAADYPDGSNAVIARFDSVEFARDAAEHLAELVPHHDMEQDLWTRHFQSESGEYVVISQIEEVVIFIIADRKELALERLHTLPALVYTEEPGLGAVIANLSAGVMLLVVALYTIFQLITLLRLFSWSQALYPAPGMPRGSADELREALQAFVEKNEIGLIVEAPSPGGGKLLEFRWREEGGQMTLGRPRLQLVFNNKKGATLAYVETLADQRDDKQYWKRYFKPGCGNSGFVIGGHEGELLLEHAPELNHNEAELYDLVAALVLQAGWRIRPVVSLVPFISGMDYQR